MIKRKISKLLMLYGPPKAQPSRTVGDLKREVWQWVVATEKQT